MATTFERQGPMHSTARAPALIQSAARGLLLVLAVTSSCSKKDDSCAAGGPRCGAVCCARGESCEQGACRSNLRGQEALCSVASRCGSRVHCSADSQCICTQTTEGDLRCGQIPEQCGVKLCQSSDDCAELGEGYFCDTPLSGCCTDPPKELSRCIAPCKSKEQCPAARFCANRCCPEGRRCGEGGECVQAGDGGATRDGGAIGAGDARGTDAGGPDSRAPGSAEAVLALAELARSGKAVDFDGDGWKEASAAIGSDGTARFQLTDPAGAAYYVSERRADGSRIVRYDAMGDGRFDYRLESTVVPPREIELRDRARDGTPDLRVTRETDAAAATVRVTVEEDVDGDGTWTIVRQLTEPAVSFAGGVCPSDTIPVPGESDVVIPGRRLVIMSDAEGSGGRCTPEQAQRLKRSFECAAHRGLICVSGTNRRLGGMLAEYLTLGGPTLMACGMGPGGCAAGARRSSGLVNYNTRILDDTPEDREGDPAAELCDVTLHELLHLAGASHEATEVIGEDVVYTCARYCAGCTKGSIGAGDPNRDCALCADSPERRERCGVAELLRHDPCGEEAPYGICHSGLACLSRTCEKCRTIQTLDCADEPLGERRFNCCLSCPSACSTNDFPCLAQEPKLKFTCDQPPPFCR